MAEYRIEDALETAEDDNLFGHDHEYRYRLRGPSGVVIHHTNSLGDAREYFARIHAAWKKRWGEPVKTFEMRHAIHDHRPPIEFFETNPPEWLLSEDFEWFWSGFVLDLRVGDYIETDFYRIQRTG